MGDLWHLPLQSSKGSLSVPVPWRIGGEEQINFFEGPLVGFGVQSPDEWNADRIRDPKQVIGFLSNASEANR